MPALIWTPALHGHARPHATTPEPGLALSLAGALGRGPWPPNGALHSLAEACSIMGQGSLESYEERVQPITFANSDLRSRYARTALFGGEVTDPKTGTPYQSKVAPRKFTGQNRGITDFPITGVCAFTCLNFGIALLSSCKHTNDLTRRRAMRQDLLATLDDIVRNAVAAFDEEGTLLGLVNHFLQTCGPPHIRAAA